MSAHMQRVAEARELGDLAGREYQHVANQTCDPGEWTVTAQEQWCRLLECIAENPYTADQYPHKDATAEQNATYAHEWAGAFKVAKRTEAADQNRKATAQ